MSDADIAKNLLLGKDLFQVYKGSYAIKFLYAIPKKTRVLVKSF